MKTVLQQLWIKSYKVSFQILVISVEKGHHFLGHFIGGADSTSQFVVSKIKEWTSSIITLSKAAAMFPQAAFAAVHVKILSI